MIHDGRKPWQIPISYNDDRFVEEQSDRSHTTTSGLSGNGDMRDADEVEELLRRPDSRDEREYECKDTTPVNYAKGPHDEEFGVDENDFDAGIENPRIVYERGPHEEAFGVDDDEDDSDDTDDDDAEESDFEPSDDSPEFDQEV